MDVTKIIKIIGTVLTVVATLLEDSKEWWGNYTCDFTIENHNYNQHYKKN